MIVVPTVEDYAAFAPETSSERNGDGSSAALNDIPAGQRNTTLASLAGSMRRRGMTESSIVLALLSENAERCRPPLSDKEVEKIARSVGRYEPAATNTALEPTEPRRRTKRLEALPIGVTAKHVDDAGDVGFLASPVWPSDAYGMLGAEDKAGKTWLVLDLAVSVASATAWLGRFDCQQGGVLLYLGEGGPRKMLRRLRAVAQSRDVRTEELPIRACYRTPYLTRADDLTEMSRELETEGARLVVIDPLYLAARGASGSDLYAMGEHLSNVQQVAQRAGAALLVTTHYNKTGEGRGPKRFTGVGPGAWGRVLVSADVINRRVVSPTTGETVAALSVNFTGDEIGDRAVNVRRRVWVDDPSDLRSPMHYEVETTDVEDEPGRGDLPPSVRRVHEVLVRAGRPLTVRIIGDELAKQDDFKLRRRTIQEALVALERLGMAERGEPDPFGGHEWSGR